MTNPNNSNPWVQVGRYLGLATMLPVATVVGYAIGYGLDHLFGTHFLRVVFLVLGAVSGFVSLIRELSRDR